MFIDTLNTILNDSKYNSSLFVCGDFNIDLLKKGSMLVPPNLLMQCIALAYIHLSINQVE